MAKLKGKAKAAFLRRMARGRAKARRKAGHAKAKRHLERRLGARVKRATTPRRKRRSPKQIAATKRMIAARRAQLGASAPRSKRKRRGAKKGHSTMAKRRKGKGKSHTSHKRRRRSKRRMSVTIGHPRRVTITNPGPSSFGGLIGTGIAGLAGGAAAGLLTTKALGAQSAGVRAGATVGLGLLGAMLLKKRPGLATAWGASTIGSLGYMFGVNAGGGVAATNKADATAQLAKISGTSTGASGMGVLTRRGLGVLTPRGVGALRPIAPIGMGATSVYAPVRQPMVYS